MSTRSRRLHSATAALTALALTLALVPAHAVAAPAAGKASVLTLEGDDPAKAVALTRALQTEFTARGVGGGREMSLAELKLTMGCEEPPAPKCLADGGKTLGVERMVYGSLTKAKGGSYSVTLNLLDVGSASVAKTASAELPASALESGQVQATAKDLVDRVLGPAQIEKPPPEATPDPEPEVQPDSDKGKLVWGRHEAARWKKIGLGVSVALTVVSFGAALGMFLAWRKPGGPVYKKMIQLARDSHEDDVDGNEVTYWQGDVCASARAPLGQGVVNAGVADQCSLGENLAKANTGMLVAGGIFLASTIAFTTLLFVHRDKQGLASKLQRRGINFGAAPTPSGVMIGGGLRF